MSKDIFPALASDISADIISRSLGVDDAGLHIREECERRGLEAHVRMVTDLVIHSLRTQQYNRFANLLGTKYGSNTGFGGDVSAEEDLNGKTTCFADIDSLLKQNKFTSALRLLESKDRNTWDCADYILAVRATVNNPSKQTSLDFLEEAISRRIEDPGMRLIEKKASVLDLAGRSDEALTTLEEVPKELWNAFMYYRAMKILIKTKSQERIYTYAEEGMTAFPGNKSIFREYLKRCAIHSWNPMPFLARTLRHVDLDNDVVFCIAHCRAKGLIPQDFFNIIMSLAKESGLRSHSLRKARRAAQNLLLEREELRGGNDVRSGFFESIQVHDLSPVDRNAYHVARNASTPRERSGDFHDPKPKKG